MLSVRDTVVNQGGAAAKSFKVSYHLSVDPVWGGHDGKLSPQRIVSSPLEPGQYNTSSGFLVKIPLTASASTYHICGQLSAVPGESNRTNNARCSEGIVTIDPPDLTMSALSTTSISARPGAVIHVSFTVTNNGGSKPKVRPKVVFTSSTNMIFGDIDGNGVPDDVPSPFIGTILALAPGQTQTVSSYRVKMPKKAGTYYVCAKVDALMVIKESDESDQSNTLCTSSTVTVAP